MCQWLKCRPDRTQPAASFPHRLRVGSLSKHNKHSGQSILCKAMFASLRRIWISLLFCVTVHMRKREHLSALCIFFLFLYTVTHPPPGKKMWTVNYQHFSMWLIRLFNTMLSLKKKVFIATLHNHYKKVVLTVRLDLIQLVQRKKNCSEHSGITAHSGERVQVSEMLTWCHCKGDAREEAKIRNFSKLKNWHIPHMKKTHTIN